MCSEIWAEVNGWESLYEISNIGRVRSVSRIVHQYESHGVMAVHIYYGKILKPRCAKNGYLYVSFNSCGRKETKKIHRMVAETFVDGRTDEMNQVNHKDGNKKNNIEENLEWCTCEQNHKHAYAIGLSKPCPFGIESYSYKGKIDILGKDGFVIGEINGMIDMKSQGYTPCGVSSVICGRQKTHRGLVFRRANND